MMLHSSSISKSSKSELDDTDNSGHYPSIECISIRNSLRRQRELLDKARQLSEADVVALTLCVKQHSKPPSHPSVL